MVTFMSFSRWGPMSDLYLFDHAGFNAVVCLGCSLMPKFTDPGGLLFGPEVQNEDFKTRDLNEMLDHIAQHRKAQDVVPDGLEDELKARWPY